MRNSKSAHTLLVTSPTANATRRPSVTVSSYVPNTYFYYTYFY